MRQSSAPSASLQSDDSRSDLVCPSGWLTDTSRRVQRDARPDDHAPRNRRNDGPRTVTSEVEVSNHLGGDNLFTDCVLALDPATGKLKWVLPVHAARCSRLGCERAQCPRQHHLSRAGAKAPAACGPQRFFLRLRSHRRQTAARGEIRPQADMGEWNWRRWPSRSDSRARRELSRPCDKLA